MNPLQAVLDSGAGMVVVIPIFLALLTLIVFVHELGHFAMARRFGVAVHTFAIGLPPRVWSRLRGADAVPAEALAGHGKQRVDGIVRIPSTTRPDLGDLRGAVLLYRDPELPTRDDLREASDAGAVGAILAAAPDAIEHLAGADDLALPAVQVEATTGTGIAARARNGDLQVEIRQDESPDGASIHIGGTRFAINALPIGGYVRMAGESEDLDSPRGFTRKRPWQRALILFAGPAMNFLLAPVLFTISSLIADEVGASLVEIAAVSPAEAAGLMADDRLLSVNGASVTGVNNVVDALRDSAGTEVALEIQRGDRIFTTRAVLRTNPPPGEGALGIRVKPVFEPAPLPLAVARGLERTGAALGLFPMAMGEWIGGGETWQLSGPVGIATIVDQAARQGLESVLFLGALLSAQIGLINLFPWPGLDGGRLVFVGFEWLTGRRLSPRREAAFHFVGIMLLLTLAVFVTIGDVQRLVGS